MWETVVTYDKKYDICQDVNVQLHQWLTRGSGAKCLQQPRPCPTNHNPIWVLYGFANPTRASVCTFCVCTWLLLENQMLNGISRFYLNAIWVVPYDGAVSKCETILEEQLWKERGLICGWVPAEIGFFVRMLPTMCITSNTHRRLHINESWIGCGLNWRQLTFLNDFSCRSRSCRDHFRSY